MSALGPYQGLKEVRSCFYYFSYTFKFLKLQSHLAITLSSGGVFPDEGASWDFSVAGCMTHSP